MQSSDNQAKTTLPETSQPEWQKLRIITSTSKEFHQTAKWTARETGLCGVVYRCSCYFCMVEEREKERWYEKVREKKQIERERLKR